MLIIFSLRKKAMDARLFSDFILVITTRSLCEISSYLYHPEQFSNKCGSASWAHTWYHFLGGFSYGCSLTYAPPRIQTNKKDICTASGMLGNGQQYYCLASNRLVPKQLRLAKFEVQCHFKYGSILFGIAVAPKWYFGWVH